MPLNLPKLYPITDVRISGLSHEEQVRRLCAGGASLIQLREKYLSPREFHRDAEAALQIARSNGARLIINDRVDLALALYADGVHLGQDDLPPAAAREILGPNAILGFSTHTVDQAITAATLSIDYIAFGPIFDTRSKEKPDAIVGLKGLREVRKAIGDRPLVAIGGIGRRDVDDILSSGADAVAVIGLLLTNPSEITALTREILDTIAPNP